MFRPYFIPSDPPISFIFQIPDSGFSSAVPSLAMCLFTLRTQPSPLFPSTSAPSLVYCLPTEGFVKAHQSVLFQAGCIGQLWFPWRRSFSWRVSLGPSFSTPSLPFIDTASWPAFHRSCASWFLWPIGVHVLILIILSYSDGYGTQWLTVQPLPIPTHSTWKSITAASAVL